MRAERPRSLIAQAIHDFEQLKGEGAAVREALGVGACVAVFFACLTAFAVMMGGAQ